MGKVTELIHGPFVVIVGFNDAAYIGSHEGMPEVYAPDGGFKTKEEAKEWVEHWEAQEDAKGMTFDIAGLRDLGSFKQFMSW